MEQERQISHNFTLDSFSKAQGKMIATNNRTYGNQDRLSYWQRLASVREYTVEEVHKIISSGSLEEQQKLSRNYFYRDGYYKQILLYYATLLQYTGLLIPNPAIGKTLSTPHIQKRYYGALDYVEKMSLKVFLTNCAISALVDGAYYGLITEIDRNAFSTIDLPAQYCITRLKDAFGNDVIEFNLAYFNTFKDDIDKKAALSVFPKEIASAYEKWQKGKRVCNWFVVPSEMAICFPLFDGRPPFLSIIPATMDYDEAVATERARDQEEIRKIIVQKIPHLTDGRLVFEPDEAEEIHKGTVGMLSGNPNLSVLTTYADVDSIASKTSNEGVQETLKKIESNIYAQGATSSEIFNSSGSAALKSSIKNNVAFMMIFANKASQYISNLLNRKFGNANVTFSYKILPIAYQDYDQYADSSFKLAGSGYSLLLPALALGLSQRDICNIKDLENDVLKLGEKLIPPSSSYTQPAGGTETDGGEAQEEPQANIAQDEGGRPTKEGEDKADTTNEKEASLEKNGGGS